LVPFHVMEEEEGCLPAQALHSTPRRRHTLNDLWSQQCSLLPEQGQGQQHGMQQQPQRQRPAFLDLKTPFTNVERGTKGAINEGENQQEEPARSRAVVSAMRKSCRSFSLGRVRFTDVVEADRENGEGQHPRLVRRTSMPEERQSRGSYTLGGDISREQVSQELIGQPTGVCESSGKGPFEQRLHRSNSSNSSSSSSSCGRDRLSLETAAAKTPARFRDADHATCQFHEIELKPVNNPITAQ
jgi:hypothetical protein